LAKVIAWLKDHLPTQRRLIQLYSALLYNAHLKGFITGNIYTGGSKALCLPGFNCYSCPGAVGACPLGALQNALAASGSRTPTYVLGILMLYGLILGRMICGFLCPLGLLQELLFKLPTPKVRKNRITRVLSWLKYIILAVFVVIVPLWYALQKYPVPAFCKYICPAGTFEGAVGLLANPVNADKFSMLGILFTRKFVILVVIAVACVFVYRAFCRFLCPLGAIYGLFAKVAVIGVKVDVPQCTDCGRCVSHCKMDIRHVGDHECIHCGECIDVCPTKAIAFKAGKIVLHGPQIDAAPAQTQKKSRSLRWVAWGVALMVLAVALVCFNRPGRPAPDPVPAQTVDDILVGKEVGMRAPDFTVPLYGGGRFTLSEHLGKTVIVNFWATWCTPCCQELPYFDELLANHADEVAIVAIHSNMVTDDVEGYLSGFNYRMSFALDETGDVITSYGGSTMLPQTVVIDANGVITYNAVGSVTYAKLETLLAAAQGGEALTMETPEPTVTSTPVPTATPAPTKAPAAPKGPVKQNGPGLKR